MKFCKQFKTAHDALKALSLGWAVEAMAAMCKMMGFRNLPRALAQRGPVVFGAGKPCSSVPLELLPHPGVVQSVQLVPLDSKGNGTESEVQSGSLCLGLWQ